MYPRISQFTYRMPENVCAYCGKQSETTSKTIFCSYTDYYFVASKSKKFRLEVPICNHCENNQKNRRKAMFYLGFGSVGLFILSLILLETSSEIGKMLIIPSVIFLFLAFLTILILIDNQKVLSFDGKNIKFKNKEFDRLFHYLNSFYF